MSDPLIQDDDPLNAVTKVGAIAPKYVAHGSGSESSLVAGQLLAGRFRIVRFIARGGMGEVYEAEDLELNEHVAVKIIREDVTWQDQPLERFRREIQLARKVTHPNVCRIFDVFHHVDGAGKRTMFLSMELLPGETLTQRLSSSGPMTPDEAFPVVLQMAAALAAAHKADVIHHDFKSSNVMLVSNDDADELPRVVVTDFGLARSRIGGETAQGSTEGFRGTPAYMAPEQLDGSEITAAVDIYAFGIVMYEMVTGNLPFPGTNLNAAFKRLTDAPPSPRVHVPGLDDNWERCILRCLESDPTKRFRTTDELVQVLRKDEIDTRDITTRPLERKKPARRKTVLAAAASTAVLVAALIATPFFRNSFQPANSPEGRRAVAVVGFTNLSGDNQEAWVSTALSEMLTTELAAGEQLLTIPGENVTRMKLELKLPGSGSFAPDTLKRMKDYLGADLVISGSYLVSNGPPKKVRVDLQLQDAANGNLLASTTDEEDSGQLPDLISRTGNQLREKLGIAKLGPNESRIAQASMSRNAEATRAYVEATEKLRTFDALGALPLLQQAVTADPDFAQAHAALATSWSMLGYPTKAKDQAKRAVELSGTLSREDQLAVEARSREAAMEWNQASEIYRTLFTFFPDNLEYGLRLAAAQTSAGKPKDAIVTVQMLRDSPRFDRSNPRIDLAEARAAGALSDFKREQSLAASAAAKGQQQGTTLLVAGARLLEGAAFTGLGDLAQARGAFEDARKIYLDVGDRWDAANSATNLAYVIARTGDPLAAKRIYDESLTIYRQVGDKKGTAAAYTATANLFRTQSNVAEAQKMHEQALAIYREVSDRAGEASSLNNVANLAAVSRDWSRATTTFENALSIFREIGDRNGEATVLGNLADLSIEKGDLAGAAKLYEQSLSLFREINNKSALAYSLVRAGDLLLMVGDIAQAAKKHEEALTVRTELGEKGAIADSRLELANIALLQSSPQNAERLAKLAVEQFRAERRTDAEASAMSVLARSYLAQTRNGEAQQAIAGAEQLLQNSNDGTLRLSVAITSASIRSALGDELKAMRDLNATILEARKAGLIGLELEAGLALGQIEIQSGQEESGRARLSFIESEARQKQYKYIADRAAAARINVQPAAGVKRRI